MKLPRLGYLCMFDNPTEEDGRALVRQFVLARDADRMGFADLWLGEHPGARAWPTPAIGVLLGHLAAATSKARIGSMLLCPALHDPLRLAEEIASVDQLSKGRVNLGVGSGAVLPAVRARSGLDAAALRERSWQVFSAAWSLLSGEEPALALPGLTRERRLVPGPVQSPLPTWVGASAPISIERAALGGHGLMAAATHSFARVAQALDTYRRARPGGDPRLVLARFACSAETRDEAVSLARPHLEWFAREAEESGCAHGIDVERLIAESLVGSHAEVAAQYQRVARELHAHAIAIVPTSHHFETCKRILAGFVDEVRPLLWD